MSVKTDFHYQMDRAGGLTIDAACACRSATKLRHLPRAQRQLLRRALRNLEDAQTNLFEARNTSWDQPSPTAQMELL